MNIDIPKILADLASHRPVFHSEADFQHEFAWLPRQTFPDSAIRLEYPLARPANTAVDIVLRRGDHVVAIELKYMCQRLEIDQGGEAFALKPQGAQDTRRHDVLKDLARMEQFVAGQPQASAGVVVISNDPAYWTGPRREGTSDADFSLREGRRVGGHLSWAPHTGAGTMRGREAPLLLRGDYQLNWQDYARLEGRHGLFRHLCIPVSGDMHR